VEFVQRYIINSIATSSPYILLLVLIFTIFMYSQFQMIPIDLFCNVITICQLPLSAHRQVTQYASSCPEKYET
jgi:hypothetical protein